MIYNTLRFFFATIIFYLVGVASLYTPCCLAADTVALAEVNGEVIYEDALYERIRAIHRYKPQTGSEGGAGGIRILDLVEEMIDERLIIQDAYKVELDRSADFIKNIKSFAATRSIIRLRKEVVLDKINISDQDILDYFKERYEKDKPVPEWMFERVKKRIRKNIRKEKEKELSDNFISKLRKQADIWIDKDMLNLLDLEKKYTGKKSVIASVNSDTISLDSFLNDMQQEAQKRPRTHSLLKNNEHPKKMQPELKEKILNNLIAFKLINQEALKRNYINEPAFTDMIKKRKERLLINEFKAKIVNPLAIPTENELTQYYREHINDYKKSYEVWFKEMIFQTDKDAEKALKELKQGASFEFLAASVSEKWKPRQGAVWINADSFAPTIKNELNRLKTGEISEVIVDDRQYKIIKLKGKRGGEPIEFSKVINTIKKITWQNNFDKALSRYLTKLRKVSAIKINKKALKTIEEKYQNS